MKALLLAVVAVGFSYSAFAATPEEVISSIESSRSVSCQFIRSSSTQICFNNICEYKSYYMCGDSKLVMSVRSVDYKDGNVDRKVTDYSFGGF